MRQHQIEKEEALPGDTLFFSISDAITLLKYCSNSFKSKIQVFGDNMFADSPMNSCDACGLPFFAAALTITNVILLYALGLKIELLMLLGVVDIAFMAFWYYRVQKLREAQRAAWAGGMQQHPGAPTGIVVTRSPHEQLQGTVISAHPHSGPMQDLAVAYPTGIDIENSQRRALDKNGVRRELS